MPNSNIDYSALAQTQVAPDDAGANQLDVAARGLRELHAMPIEGVHLQGPCLRIPRLIRRSDQRPFVEFDLSSLSLPPTPFSEMPTPLTDRAGLVLALFKSTKNLSRRLAASKSFHGALSCHVWAVAKFLEYGWLHGCYSLADWTPAVSERLAAELASGGWEKALRIEERTNKLIEGMTPEGIRPFLSPTSARGNFSVTMQFRQALGTNCRLSSARVAKPILMKAAGIELVLDPQDQQVRESSSKRGVSANYLYGELSSINSLADGGPGIDALGYVPYPKTKRSAETLGRAPGRTANIGPSDVAALLVEATKWIRDLSDPILLLLTDVGAALEREKLANVDAKKRIIKKAIRQSSGRAVLEEALGLEIRGAHISKFQASEKDISIGRLVHLLMTACYVTLAIFNARRRDEISHRRVGLHRSAMTAIDAHPGLYECEFYIEKTHRTYVPFFIGRQSQAAIRVLEKTSDLARRFAQDAAGNRSAQADPREIGLFQVPRLHDIGRSSKPTWFLFSASYFGRSKEFVHRALDGRQLRVRSHMFRRAYALLFHYRYENASLIALAQQLGHFDLDTVSMYVTDAGGQGIGPSASALYGKLTPAQRAAMNDHGRYMEEAIREVGRERISEFVADVLSGRVRYSGGFSSLVQRFHQKLGRRLDFSSLAGVDQAAALASRLVDRGHDFVPFVHGNCAAAAARPGASAGCYSRTDGALHRENASPKTCGRCPYHVVAASHLESLISEHRRLTSEASSLDHASFKRARLVAQLASLGRAIVLHRSRLEDEERHV